MISKLHTATKQAYPLDGNRKIVVTTPLLPGLPIADLNEAIEYAGLSSWLIGYGLYPGVLTQSRSAAAVWNIGLCDDYKHLSCQMEAVEKGNEVVYFIM